MARHSDYCHVRASSFLLGAQLGPERSFQAIESDQTRILSAFDHLKTIETRNILFDAHSVVRNHLGIFVVPTAIVRAISPDLIVLLDVDPEIAKRRRIARNGTSTLQITENISEERNLARAACEAYSQELELPLRIAVTNDGFTLDAILLHNRP